MISLPILMLVMGNVAEKNREMLTIAVVNEADPDEYVSSIIDKMTEKSGVLKYVFYDSPKEAETDLRNGRCDAVWIFPENFREEMKENAQAGVVGPVVKMLQRDQTAAVQLTKEQLSSFLYPVFSYENYKSYVINVLKITDVEEEELREQYDRALIKNDLFEMGYLDGEIEEDNGYLVAPMRGIMALWLVLCGLAANMYELADEKNGVFSNIPPKKRWRTALCGQGVVLLDGAVIMMISLKLAGVFTVFGKEFLNLALFAGCTFLFCGIFRLIFRKAEIMGFSIPLLMAAMLVLCPVFLKIKGLRFLKILLPPYYYLNGVHNDHYRIEMILYIFAAGIMLIVGHLFSKKQ